jgi:hypothetical protein
MDRYRPKDGDAIRAGSTGSMCHPAGGTMRRFSIRNLTPFRRVGHCLFTFLAGLLGGTVGVWFYTRRETGGRDADPPRPGL